MRLGKFSDLWMKIKWKRYFYWMICRRWRKAKLLQENYKKTYWRLQNKHTESKRKEWKERERFVRKRSLLFHYMKDLHNVQVYIVNLRIQKARITHKYLLEISSNNQNRLSHLNTCHNRILESVTNCCFAAMRWNAPCDLIRVAFEKRTWRLESQDGILF